MYSVYGQLVKSILCTIYHENSFCGNVSENISLQFTISIVAVGFVGNITAMSEKQSKRAFLE